MAIVKLRPPLLVLKGLDTLYGSGQSAQVALHGTIWDSTPSPSAESWVELIGDDLPRDRLVALYRAADAYVSASMAEAFQMPLAEAMAAGMPVVAPAGGPAEEFLDGESAVLVPSATTPWGGRQAPSAHVASPGRSRGVVVAVDGPLLSAALEDVLTNRSRRAARAWSRGPLWTSNLLTMEMSADAVLAEVMNRRAEAAKEAAKDQGVEQYASER